jgi:putative ABC transport system permease protein
MIWTDFLRLSSSSVIAHRMRSFLTALGIAIGIAAVVLLTSIGEGIHRFVLDEFTQFGTTLIAINPGKATTMGGSVGVFGTVRPLSVEDAEALKRLPKVKETVSFTQGNAPVKGNGLQRRTTVYGTTSGFPETFAFKVSIGEFLPDDDPRSPRAFAVLGSKMRDELYGNRNPLGELIRVGGDRYRIIGVMESKGNVLGFDLDDTVYIPVVRALELFNRESLMEIDVLYEDGAPVDELVAGIRRIIIARHGGEDVTITTQDQMMDVLGSILDVLTFAVGALGSISLLVGGVGIFTIMTIAVGERTNEIGLLRALGAEHDTVLRLFLGEAVVLAAIGGMGGLILGGGLALSLNVLMPSLPIHTPVQLVVLAESVAIVIGLIAGVVPARRAASLQPVEALRTE